MAYRTDHDSRCGVERDGKKDRKEKEKGGFNINLGPSLQMEEKKETETRSKFIQKKSFIHVKLGSFPCTVKILFNKVAQSNETC